MSSPPLSPPFHRQPTPIPKSGPPFFLPPNFPNRLTGPHVLLYPTRLFLLLSVSRVRFPHPHNLFVLPSFLSSNRGGSLLVQRLSETATFFVPAFFPFQGLLPALSYGGIRRLRRLYGVRHTPHFLSPPLSHPSSLFLYRLCVLLPYIFIFYLVIGSEVFSKGHIVVPNTSPPPPPSLFFPCLPARPSFFPALSHPCLSFFVPRPAARPFFPFACCSPPPPSLSQWCLYGFSSSAGVGFFTRGISWLLPPLWQHQNT